MSNDTGSKPLAEMSNNRGLRLLQYGESGAGKTTRAAMAARWGIVEFHDFDDKIQNLLPYIKKNNPELLNNILVKSYRGLNDNEKINSFMSRIKEYRDPKCNVKTLVIDSYTRFEKLYMNYLMDKIPLSPTAFGLPRITSDINGEKFTIAGTMDGDRLVAATFKLLGWLKDLNMNVILNGHLRKPLETKQKGTEEGTIAARGQIREWLATEFLEFHRLFIDSYMKNRVQVRSTVDYIASTALTDVPPTGVLLDNSLAVFDNIAIKETK